MEDLSRTKKPLTARDVDIFSTQIQDVLSRGTYLQICRNFFVQAAGKAAARDFESMKQAALELGLFTTEDNPTSEADLCLMICEHILGLGKEPSIVRNEMLERTMKDLAFVESNITSLEGKYHMAKSKSPQSEEDVLEERLAKHYLDRNLAQQKEILKFLSTPSAVDDYVRTQSGRHLSLFDQILRGPSYYLIERNLTYRSPSPLDNKFGDLTIQDHHALTELYQNDIFEFEKLVSQYIQDNGTVNSIRKSVESSLTLVSRKDALLECLDLFDAGKLWSFSTVILVQLEGIFEDICLSVGLDFKKMGRMGLVDKLDALMKKKEYHEGFYQAEEYYRFYLPYLRNKAAHSKSLPLQIDILSNLLLLDFEEVMTMTESKWIPVNKKLQALQNVENSSNNDRWRSLLLLIALHKTQFPDSGLITRQQTVEVLLFEDDFWQFLTRFAAIEKSAHGGLRQVLGELKHRSGLKERTETLLSSLNHERNKSGIDDVFIFVIENRKLDSVY
jgi:hypothetical protein